VSKKSASQESHRRPDYRPPDEHNEKANSFRRHFFCTNACRRSVLRNAMRPAYQPERRVPPFCAQHRHTPRCALVDKTIRGHISALAVSCFLVAFECPVLEIYFRESTFLSFSLFMGLWREERYSSAQANGKAISSCVYFCYLFCSVFFSIVQIIYISNNSLVIFPQIFSNKICVILPVISFFSAIAPLYCFLLQK
jgi:hypothetical protein